MNNKIHTPVIFDIFRKKIDPDGTLEVLKTDIHSHLIPNVDDGSHSYDFSIQCIQRMAELGYSKICLTPHFQSYKFKNDEDDILERAEKLRQAIAEQNIKMELIVGGEYLVDSGFRKRLETNRFLKMNNQYLLIEFSFNQAILGINELVFELQKMGHEVILAHPERYIYFYEHPEIPKRLKDQGVYFQSNITSFTGFYSKRTIVECNKYIANGWTDFLGTDMHNSIYLEALVKACQDRKFRKILDTYQFLNNTI